MNKQNLTTSSNRCYEGWADFDTGNTERFVYTLTHEGQSPRARDLASGPYHLLIQGVSKKKFLTKNAHFKGFRVILEQNVRE